MALGRWAYDDFVARRPVVRERGAEARAPWTPVRAVERLALRRLRACTQQQQLPLLRAHSYPNQFHYYSKAVVLIS